MGTAEIQEKLQSLLAPRAEADGIAAAYLFGSVARGTARPDSDVDVGVLYSKDPPKTWAGLCLSLDLEGDLERALGLPVQVVALNDAPVDLIIRVLRDGKLLVDRDRSRRIQFEVRSRNELWDLEPYLRLSDTDLIAKKLAYIESCVHEIKTLAHPEAIRSDIREWRFIAYTLQTAVQAALDAAAHIVSDEHLGEPKTNRDLFDLLLKNGWLPERLDEPLRRMVGFRNILVHGYQAVDLSIVEEVVLHHLDDLLEFAQAVRERLARA
jgi:uncharacterized protein YutE (UPF0331/DUF86 family)/predicted nucleotidyltransferase